VKITRPPHLARGASSTAEQGATSTGPDSHIPNPQVA
jgi:hypothetical protein